MCLRKKERNWKETACVRFVQFWVLWLQCQTAKYINLTMLHSKIAVLFLFPIQKEQFHIYRKRWKSQCLAMCRKTCVIASPGLHAAAHMTYRQSSCSTSPCWWSCHPPMARFPEQLICRIDVSVKTAQKLLPALQYHFPVSLHELSNVTATVCSLSSCTGSDRTAVAEDME